MTIKREYFEFSLRIRHYVHERGEFGGSNQSCFHWFHLFVFIAFVSFCILLAGIVVGIQTYDSMAEDPILNAIDIFILSVFSLEVIVKIISEGIDPLKFLLPVFDHY